jgi:hypothetical protein
LILIISNIFSNFNQYSRISISLINLPSTSRPQIVDSIADRSTDTFVIDQEGFSRRLEDMLNNSDQSSEGAYCCSDRERGRGKGERGNCDTKSQMFSEAHSFCLSIKGMDAPKED